MLNFWSSRRSNCRRFAKLTANGQHLQEQGVHLRAPVLEPPGLHAHDARARARGRGSRPLVGRRVERPADGGRERLGRADRAGLAPAEPTAHHLRGARRAQARTDARAAPHPPARRRRPRGPRQGRDDRGVPPALRAAARAVPRGAAAALRPQLLRERLLEHGDGVGQARRARAAGRHADAGDRVLVGVLPRVRGGGRGAWRPDGAAAAGGRLQRGRVGLRLVGGERPVRAPRAGRAAAGHVVQRRRGRRGRGGARGDGRGVGVAAALQPVAIARARAAQGRLCAAVRERSHAVPPEGGRGGPGGGKVKVISVDALVVVVCGVWGGR